MPEYGASASKYAAFNDRRVINVFFKRIYISKVKMLYNTQISLQLNRCIIFVDIPHASSGFPL
ncbi:hypothetical protein D5952_21950 [Salmonella enterica subsp. enterica]|nr:hypothetical protein [Salmonella enterica subsp. enterica serovar Bonn]MLZ42536.1 hypothetical protein [Salmonella enterica subsp. enterica serovar Bonn]